MVEAVTGKPNVLVYGSEEVAVREVGTGAAIAPAPAPALILPPMPPAPAPLSVPTGTRKLLDALAGVTIASPPNSEDFYVEIAIEMTLVGFLAEEEKAAGMGVRCCVFVKGVFLNVGGRRIPFDSGSTWRSG